MIEAVIFVVMVGVVVLVVVLSALLYLYCGSASNKSLKHKVFGCFLVHFLPGSGCIGVGGVDGGVVLVVVVVVVVRVVVEVVAFYLFFKSVEMLWTTSRDLECLASSCCPF